VTARPSVLELDTWTRNWWVEVVDPLKATWKWTYRREQATVFPTRAAADRFRVNECRLFLTSVEKQRLHAVDA
jgi:hypothetical protein